MKSIKISDFVHRELKMYLAKGEEERTVTQFADHAITNLLSIRGHKFSTIKKEKKV